jgi:hypothetical protein
VRGGERGPALGVSEGRREQVGEVRHALGGVGRKRPAPGQHRHCAPQAALDDDRARHHRPDSQRAEAVGDRIRLAAPDVLVDPGGAAGPPHDRRGKVVAQFQARPDRQPDRVVADAADDHDRGPVGLEAGYAGVVGAEQPADLLGDGQEDLGRVDAVGDERGDPAERGLLRQEAGELVTARLERASHRIERALELTDLARTGFGQPRVEVAIRESAGHPRRPTNGGDDHPRQVSGEDQHEQDRPTETGDSPDNRAASGRVSAVLAGRDADAFYCRQAVEFGAERVDALLPLVRRRDAVGRRISRRMRSTRSPAIAYGRDAVSRRAADSTT